MRRVMHTLADLRRATATGNSTAALYDKVGATFGTVPLRPFHLGDGGLLGALSRGDTAVSALIARVLDCNMVACKLGMSFEHHARISTCEGKRAWAHMRPGEVQSMEDGRILAGVAPSGAPRGDRFVLFEELRRRSPSDTWPALTTAHEALSAVGSAISYQLEHCTSSSHALRLTKMSDTFVACFPGDGLGYPSHFDGDEACRLTIILYTSTSYRHHHGGCLRMLDEERRCWHEVQPAADTLVIFRSDKVLHKVEPCFDAPRYALTVFLSDSRAREKAEESALLASLAFTV